MSVNAIDLSRPQRFSQFQLQTASQPDFGNSKPRNEKVIKAAAAAGSLIGMSAVLTLIAKKQGFPVNPKVLKNIPIKDWAFFKIAKKGVENQKLLQIEEKEILALASGSIAGGLTAGAIVDKKNMKAKFRESITQMLGNVIVPVAFVGGTSRIYSKYEDVIKNTMPQIKNATSKFTQGLNKFSKILPAVGITFAALGAGIYAGSKVTNFINEKFFGQKTKRDIKTTDFAPHVDDICLAVTLMGAKDSPFASTITRTVPLFLSVPGYQVGKAKEN